MNTSTHEPLDAVVADLIGHGLAPDYAQRAASELADHHQDLVEELEAAGWAESYALSEASRRLGDTRALVRKTVREYRGRFWCGRWPLLTFLFGPVSGLLMLWLTSGLILLGISGLIGLVIDESTLSAIEPVVQYVVRIRTKVLDHAGFACVGSGHDFLVGIACGYEPGVALCRRRHNGDIHWVRTV